jgi:polyisoprenoid-binding protein YceI
MSNTETLTGVPVGTWTLDPIHSNVGFEVKYLVGTFRGQFRDIDGKLVVSDEGRATLEGSARVASVDVKDEMLSGHLQSPDFFDVERYPELRFESTSIRIEGDEAILEGELTIKGNTNPVTARGAYVGPHEDIAGNTKLGLELTAIVDRTEFGLNWNAPLPKGGVALGNDVTLSVDLELAKA